MSRPCSEPSPRCRICCSCVVALMITATGVSAAMPPADRRELGERAERHARAHYDWERVVDRYEELFRRMTS